MDSEHRHELQTNSLAAFLINLPELIKTHSSKIMTVLALILLGVAVWNYRHKQYLAREQQIGMSLSNAWNTFDQFQRLNPSLPADARAKALDQFEADINNALSDVFDSADSTADHARLASAYQLKGDLYWALASDTGSITPSTQPVATQPTSRPVADYLSKAEAAYTKILSDFTDVKPTTVVARFGLAAIAENRGDWTAARKYYNEVMNDVGEKSASGNVNYTWLLAKTRNDKVEDLQKPFMHVDPKIVLKQNPIGDDLLKSNEKPVDSTNPGLSLPSLLPK